MTDDDLAHVTDPAERRKILKQRLRNKLQKNGDLHTHKQQMQKDPTTALLNLGVEDVNLLRMAPNIQKNPKAMIDDLKSMMNTKLTEEDIDEEAPPE